MSTDRNAEYLAGLVRELCKLPRETEWVEFKVNNSDPQEIGQYLSETVKKSFTKARQVDVSMRSFFHERTIPVVCIAA